MLQYRWSPTMKEKPGRQLTADGATARQALAPLGAGRHPPIQCHAAPRQSEGDQHMSHAHQSRPSCHAQQARGVAARRARHVSHISQRHMSASPRERARVVARLIAASQALPANPDAAALLLDGALSQLLDLWAQQARVHLSDHRQALAALDACAPAIAGRVRLALQARQPEARLAHCWALLDLLTAWPTATHTSTGHATPRTSDQIAERHADLSASRKDGESHVS